MRNHTAIKHFPACVLSIVLYCIVSKADSFEDYTGINSHFDTTANVNGLKTPKLKLLFNFNSKNFNF